MADFPNSHFEKDSNEHVPHAIYPLGKLTELWKNTILMGKLYINDWRAYIYIYIYRYVYRLIA